MPNGYHGTKEEWTRLEGPLRELDPIFESFASKHGYTLSRNYRGDPERSLKSELGLSRLIQIFVADDKIPTYKVWLCASEDRGLERYWKTRFITESATAEELKTSILSWLQQGSAEVMAWKSADLVFATRLRSLS